MNTTGDYASRHRLLADYLSQLDAECDVVVELAACAARQHAAATARDLDALEEATSTRARLYDALLACEQQLRPVREAVGQHAAAFEGTDEFGRLNDLHGRIREAIALTLDTDEKTTRCLAANDHELRTATQTLEAAEATLSAYRRVVAPPPEPAALVNRRG